MNTDTNKPIYRTVIMVAAGIWLFFSSIVSIKAVEESKTYNTTSNTLSQEMIDIQNIMKANKALQNQEYEKSLTYISWDNDIDYYNRWTLQMLLAYKNAIQNDVSWLQHAQTFIAQAEQSFEIAQKLSNSKQIRDSIIENQTTVQALSPVIDIKTCYGIGQTIITSIDDINTTINNIKDVLKQEEEYIKKKAWSLSQECNEKLRSTVYTSKEQISLLETNMKYNRQTYIADFSDKIDNPMICINTPYENILPSILKWKAWVEEYQKLHKDTIEIFQSNNKQKIDELCSQTKNDAQINQDINNAIQELLQKLEENTLKKQKNRATQEIQYKDFFNEDEKKTLQEIETINQWWIKKILQIRGKGNYTPEQYINDMFNQFYGNSGDFVNLHK